MEYTILLKSRDMTTGVNNNARFTYDFAHFEEGHYELTFTYKGRGDSIFNQRGYVITHNLGTDYVKTAGANPNQESNILGLLEGINDENNSYKNGLIARLSTTPPIKIRKPTVSSIDIGVNDYAGTPALDNWGGDIANFQLYLHFKKC